MYYLNGPLKSIVSKFFFNFIQEYFFFLFYFSRKRKATLVSSKKFFFENTPGYFFSITLQERFGFKNPIIFFEEKRKTWERKWETPINNMFLLQILFYVKYHKLIWIRLFDSSRFKSVQRWLKNNHLSYFSDVRSKSLIHPF